jgi:hypothetical protein
MLEENAVGIPTVKDQYRRFKARILSVYPKIRSGRDKIDLAESISQMLRATPFLSAKIRVKRLVMHPTTIKQTLITDVEMKKFIRRWHPNCLNPSQQIMSHKFQRSVSGN